MILVKKKRKVKPLILAVNDEVFRLLDKVDYVLFSSRSGAEEHVDTHLKHLDIYTYIIPIILPKEEVVLIADKKEYILSIGKPVMINHQIPHSLVVKNDSPIVLVMASKVL